MIRSSASRNGTVRRTPRLMAGYRVWDLVKVPFPYTNRPVQQRRPALVVAVPDALGRPGCCGC